MAMEGNGKAAYERHILMKMYREGVGERGDGSHSINARLTDLIICILIVIDTAGVAFPIVPNFMHINFGTC